MGLDGPISTLTLFQAAEIGRKGGMLLPVVSFKRTKHAQSCRRICLNGGKALKKEVPSQTFSNDISRVLASLGESLSSELRAGNF